MRRCLKIMLASTATPVPADFSDNGGVLAARRQILQLCCGGVMYLLQEAPIGLGLGRTSSNAQGRGIGGDGCSEATLQRVRGELMAD